MALLSRFIGMVSHAAMSGGGSAGPVGYSWFSESQAERERSGAMPELAASLLPIVNFVKILGNESIAIGHFYFGESRGVDDVIFLDDVIAIQDERREGIDFIDLERSFLIPRHGAADVIKNRGCERPVAPRGHLWMQRSECALASDERGSLRAAFLTFAVARSALFAEQARASFGVSAACEACPTVM